MLFFGQTVVSGLTAGAIYALLGLGFVLIYQATRALNLSHGDVLMSGAIGGLFLYLDHRWGYWATFLAVLLIGCLLGVVLHWVAYQPLSRQPLFTIILATVAFGQVLRGLVRVLRGSELRSFPSPVGGKTIVLGGLAIAPASLVVTVACILAMAAISLMLRYTKVGRAMRAIAQNTTAATLMGVRVVRVTTLVWALASGLAAMAGLLIAPVITITPDMGDIAIKGFVGAVLGGFTGIAASVAGGFLLGVLDNLIASYISTGMRDVGTFLVLVLILWLRPQGLFVRATGRRV